MFFIVITNSRLRDITIPINSINYVEELDENAGITNAEQYTVKTAIHLKGDQKTVLYARENSLEIQSKMAHPDGEPDPTE